jgi:hypothetical protein
VGAANCKLTETGANNVAGGVSPVTEIAGIGGGLMVELHEKLVGVELAPSVRVTANVNGPDEAGVPETATVVVGPVAGLALSQEGPVKLQL